MTAQHLPPLGSSATNFLLFTNSKFILVKHHLVSFGGESKNVWYKFFVEIELRVSHIQAAGFHIGINIRLRLAEFNVLD